eukprot:COSAG01_NODE_1526_length_10016_cov_8.480085_11_plen_76_part_00
MMTMTMPPSAPPPPPPRCPLILLSSRSPRWPCVRPQVRKQVVMREGEAGAEMYHLRVIITLVARTPGLAELYLGL